MSGLVKKSNTCAGEEKLSQLGQSEFRQTSMHTGTQSIEKFLILQILPGVTSGDSHNLGGTEPVWRILNLLGHHKQPEFIHWQGRGCQGLNKTSDLTRFQTWNLMANKVCEQLHDQCPQWYWSFIRIPQNSRIQAGCSKCCDRATAVKQPHNFLNGKGLFLMKLFDSFPVAANSSSWTFTLDLLQDLLHLWSRVKLRQIRSNYHLRWW